MNTFAIQSNSLLKTYGSGRTQVHAVDGLSLNVPEGSIYGLLGRNSAGKTTTIRMAMGLARPTSGEIKVFGLNPTHDPERLSVLRQVGYVPEDKALLALTPRKQLELNRSFYPQTWSDDLARKVVRRLELPLDTPLAKLSLGNKTKSALAVAIAQRSRLLILDEPTTGLDPIALDALRRRTGVANSAITPSSMVANGATPFISASADGRAVAAIDALTPTEVRFKKCAGNPQRRPTIR